MNYKRKSPLSLQTIDCISKMYWEEGYEQSEIANAFGKHQGVISRIVNNKVRSIEEFLGEKLLRLKSNIQPNDNEPKQAKALRAKREILPITKLSTKKVEQIRSKYFSGESTQKELAASYKVNGSTICRIIRGEKWKK
jgi:DNA-binding transcriptional regulator LsrR (DeoR family)